MTLDFGLAPYPLPPTLSWAAVFFFLFFFFLLAHAALFFFFLLYPLSCLLSMSNSIAHPVRGHHSCGQEMGPFLYPLGWQ